MKIQFQSILRRELIGFAAEPLMLAAGAAFIAVSMAMPLYFGGFFEREQADLQALFLFMPWIFLIMAPAVGMRAWAEEIQSGTLEIILVSPIPSRIWVWGKFAAAWAVLSVLIALTFPIVLVLAYLGDPDWGMIASGYLGTFLLAGGFLAMAQFASAVAPNQVIAFIFGLMLGFIFSMAASPLVAGMAGLNQWGLDFLAQPLLNLSMQAHYAAMTEGAVTLPAIAYFATLIGLFQYLTVLALEKRRA